MVMIILLFKWIILVTILKFIGQLKIKTKKLFVTRMTSIGINIMTFSTWKINVILIHFEIKRFCITKESFYDLIWRPYHIELRIIKNQSTEWLEIQIDIRVFQLNSLYSSMNVIRCDIVFLFRVFLVGSWEW